MTPTHDKQVCPACRLLQQATASCAFCGAALGGALPTRLVRLESGRAFTRDVGSVGAVVIPALAGFAGVLSAPSAGLGFALVLACVLSTMVLVVGAGPWRFVFSIVVAAFAVLLSTLHPTLFFVVLLLIVAGILLPLLAGVPSMRLASEPGRLVLAGTEESEPVRPERGISGFLEPKAGGPPRAWELRDTAGQLLVRGVEGGPYVLHTEDGEIPLDGALSFDVQGVPYEINASKAYRLGISEDVPLPTTLRFVEMAVGPEMQVEVFGRLVDEPQSSGYREVSFSRRMDFSAGAPIFIRPAS